MRIYHRLEDVRSLSSGTAVAIGNFDGLHLGHRKILLELVRTAGEKNLSSFILTFSPHPEKVLGKGAIQMIQTLEQRLAGFRSFGIDAAVVVPFDKTFARRPAGDFIRGILIRDLDARYVFVGRNFHFGRHRQGDLPFLRRMARKEGFLVKAVPPVTRNGRPVSSTLIRTLLYHGKVEEASRLLGHAFEIQGFVVLGEGRGRILGFPTANIRTSNEILPPGVFMTEAVIRGRCHPSLTSIGCRPTFGGRKLTVECHVIDFDKNLYGTSFPIRFLKKIRNEIRFKNAEELRRRMLQDAAQTRIFFKQTS